MAMNAQVAELLAQFADMPAPDYDKATPEEVRALSDNPMAVGPPPAVAAVEDYSIDLDGRTLAARLYIPEGASNRPSLTLYYHGGGWVVGTLETHDATCRALARASGSAILSVAYRLAPEHAYPAAAEDGYDALVWAVTNAARLGVSAEGPAVAGDSAGGNIAAAVAIMARDRGGPELRRQVLIYPVIDDDFERQSYVENGAEGNFLTTKMMRWFWDHYLGDTDPRDAPLARLMMQSDLAGVAPATIITAELDPLRDEAVAYAERLRTAGVEVQATEAPGMIHGFASLFEFVPDALPYIEWAGKALRSEDG